MKNKMNHIVIKEIRNVVELMQGDDRFHINEITEVDTDNDSKRCFDASIHIRSNGVWSTVKKRFVFNEDQIISVKRLNDSENLFDSLKTSITRCLTNE